MSSRIEKCLFLLFSLVLSGIFFAPSVAAQIDKNSRQETSVFAAPPPPTNINEFEKEMRGETLTWTSDLSKPVVSGEVNFAREKYQAADGENREFGKLVGANVADFTARFYSKENLNRQNSKSKYLPADDENKNTSVRSTRESVKIFDDEKNSSSPLDTGFQWKSAIQQSLIFLAVQHGYALTQPKTREALNGKFFDDYIKSVKSLHGWGDGGRFFTNYIAHPMQGSLTGFIYVQNDPQARRQQFGGSPDYWRGRMKAMAWTAAWSTQFEIGPISQASIGNVGLKGKQTWVDIVMTPTLGTAMLIGEDAVDRFIVQSIERRTDNFYVKIFSRMLLNPTRNFSNLLRFKAPWYRDRPTAH